MKIQYWRILFFLSLILVTSCKMKQNETHSELESVGYQSKALLLRRVGDTQIRPLNDGAGGLAGANAGQVEFVICDRTPASDRKFVLIRKSCQPAFHAKKGSRNLILDFKVAKLEEMKNETAFRKGLWSVLNAGVDAGRLAGGVFITVGAAAAGTIAGTTAGGAGGSAVPVLGTTVGAIYGGVTGFAIGMLKGAALDAVWFTSVGLVQGQTTYKWKRTDETVSRHFKAIFELDSGKNMETLKSSQEYAYVLKWIERTFNAELNAPYKVLATGNNLEFDPGDHP